MAEFENQDIDVDALMREIRAEVSTRTARALGASRRLYDGTASGATNHAAAEADRVSLPRLAESTGTMPRKRKYALQDFLNYHDEEFLRNAYRAILGRDPDAAGASPYLARLRDGSLARVEVLGRIRFSQEGRAAAVPVTGLLIPFGVRTLRHVPILGHLLEIIQSILRLPGIVGNQERLESVVFHHRLETRRGVNAIEAEIESALQRIQERDARRATSTEAELAVVKRTTSAKVDRISESIDSIAARVAAKADRPEIDALEQRIHSEQGAHRMRLARQLEAIAQGKADRVQLEALVEQSGAAQRELHASVTAIEQGKADRVQLEALVEQSGAAQRELYASVTAIEQGKLDGAVFDAMVASLRAELIALEQREVDHVKLEAEKVNAELVELRGWVSEWTAGQPSHAMLLEAIAALESAKTDASRIESGLATMRQQLLGYRQDLLEEERRLAVLLDEAGKRLPRPRHGAQPGGALDANNHLLDGFYASFEDAFRGTSEDIKERVEVYLPYVREAGAGTASAPILDVGCGRGEWLELLKENGLASRGVDLNHVMAARSRERDLEVIEADGLDYLRGLKANSLGAVTAFHVIEHIPFRQVVSLFDEVRRVLKPGGIAILETPNPENLIVGACNFWYDPTHQRPLPPEPMHFVLQSRGFERVEILRLHPRTDCPVPVEAPDALRSVFVERLFGPQDYALIAYKA